MPISEFFLCSLLPRGMQEYWRQTLELKHTSYQVIFTAESGNSNIPQHEGREGFNEWGFTNDFLTRRMRAASDIIQNQNFQYVLECSHTAYYSPSPNFSIS